MAMFEGPNKIAEAMQARRAAYEATQLGQEAVARGNASLERRTAINQAAADNPIYSPEEQAPTGSAFSGRTMFDRLKDFANRGGTSDAPRPISMPTPAVSFSSGAAPAPAAASTAGSAVAEAQELPFVAPAASNYESPHAANKRYLEIVADMATAVGHREAPKFRAAAVESHLTEAADRAEAAQKAFIKGDIDGAIAGFNAAAGGDNPILGYRKEKGGYTLKTAQGSQFRTDEQIQNALATLRNPQLIGQIALKQAEKQADLYNKVTEAKVKHQMSMEEAVLKGVLSRDQAMELAQFNKTHGGNKTHVSMTGEVFIDKADGTTVKVEQRPGRLDPKIKEWVEIPVAAGPPAGRGAQPASQGTMIDAARFAAALGGAR